MKFPAAERVGFIKAILQNHINVPHNTFVPCMKFILRIPLNKWHRIMAYILFSKRGIQSNGKDFSWLKEQLFAEMIDTILSGEKTYSQKQRTIIWLQFSHPLEKCHKRKNKINSKESITDFIQITNPKKLIMAES